MVPAIDGALAELAQEFVTWLESGVRPGEMFTSDVFADLSVPHWRVQAEGTDAVFHLREESGEGEP